MVQLFLSGASERIDLHAPSTLRLAPLRCDPADLFQLQQGGVERALVERQLVAADLLDAAGDAITVERAQRLEGLEHHQSQAAVEDVALVGRHMLEGYSCTCWESTG